MCNQMPSPAAVLVTVTWFCMCMLHMLCQMASNERVEFIGEAGVFPSLLPDNAPSGAGEMLPPTPRQPGNKHAQSGWQGEIGWDGNWEMSGADIIPTKTTRLNTCQRVKITATERAWSWELKKILHKFTHSNGQVEGKEFKVTLMEVRSKVININVNALMLTGVWSLATEFICCWVWLDWKPAEGMKRRVQVCHSWHAVPIVSCGRR